MHIIGHGKRNLAKLLATGQLTAYGSGAGVDDGALQKGNAKNYTVLTLGQYAGTTNIAINSKTDVHSNNCVFDNGTRLMWSRYPSAGVGPSSNGQIPWTTNGSGEGIFDYCAAANAAGLSGYADWRIPNMFEYASLYDLEAPSGIPDTTAFPTWQNIEWTSTTEPDATTSAIRTSSTIGVFAGSAKTGNNYVSLVRGG